MKTLTEVELLISNKKDLIQEAEKAIKREEEQLERGRRGLQAMKDELTGMADCKAGIFDKWYRYHKKDEGFAYNAGWHNMNNFVKNEKVNFIGKEII